MQKRRTKIEKGATSSRHQGKYTLFLKNAPILLDYSYLDFGFGSLASPITGYSLSSFSEQFVEKKKSHSYRQRLFFFIHLFRSLVRGVFEAHASALCRRLRAVAIAMDRDDAFD